MNKLLLTYMRETEIPDDMKYKDSAISQMCIVRDKLASELCNVPVFVIGTHRSKSIELPVYGMVLKNGVKIIMSDNFHGIILTAELPAALPKNYLKDRLGEQSYFNKNIGSLYCSGFKKEWCHNGYDPEDENCTKFTIELNNYYQVYEFLHILKLAFPEIQYQKETRTAVEIAKSLRDIYEANGTATMVDCKLFAYPKLAPMVDEWEVIWDYYVKIQTNFYKRNEYNKLTAEPDKFAEIILQESEYTDLFQCYENMFKTQF